MTHSDPQPLKILLSYWYFKTLDLDQFVAALDCPVMVFIDSGGYSAGTQGIEISVEEYASWITRWRHHITVYANLDQVSYKGRQPVEDAAATLVNQRRLEDEYGLQPIPVFHAGEDWSYLEGYCERYPYIALGGMASNAPPAAVVRWAVQCFRIAQGSGAVFHGFGQTRKHLLTAVPWYSVDSSSWGGGHRYGGVDLWNDRTHRFVKVRVGDPKSVYQHAALIRAHGVDPSRLADRSRYHHFHALACNAQAWRKYERWLRRLHGPVPCAGRTDGLHLYLAEGSKENLMEAGRAVAAGEGSTR